MSESFPRHRRAVRRRTIHALPTLWADDVDIGVIVAVSMPPPTLAQCGIRRHAGGVDDRRAREMSFVRLMMNPESNKAFQ